jgi:hypothetical protein
MTHRELCLLGAKYMKSKGIVDWNKVNYVVVEIELTGGAQPDIYGFGYGASQQIEVKVNRSDFLSDKNKFQRRYPHLDAGEYRSYLCPDGLIKTNELPENWGLLYIDDKKQITRIVNPEKQESSVRKEIEIICSVMRRLEIKPQIFSFKNYKEDEVLKLTAEL